MYYLQDQLGTFVVEVRSDEEFSSYTDFGNLAVKMVQTDRHTCYPLVYRLIELALILPIATTAVERVFSTMNTIKTGLRNKMNDNWVDDSKVYYVKQDIFTTYCGVLWLRLSEMLVCLLLLLHIISHSYI